MTTTPELDAVRLSTAPEPVGPVRQRQLLAPVRRSWRQLTSMRTALLLLFLLALGAVPGGFLPQRSLNPVRVDEYIATHPSLAPGNFTRLPASARWETGVPAEEALEAGRRTLRGWRAVRRGSAVSAE